MFFVFFTLTSVISFCFFVFHQQKRWHWPTVFPCSSFRYLLRQLFLLFLFIKTNRQNFIILFSFCLNVWKQIFSTSRKKCFYLAECVYYIALVNNCSGYYLCTFLDTFFLDVFIFIYCVSYQTFRPFYIASLAQRIRALLLSTTMIGRFLLNF